MFEYLPEEELPTAEYAEYKEKSDKKPLLVKLAVFRLAVTLFILAAMLLFRVFCPQETEKTSEEFKAAAETETIADKYISEAAELFMEFVEKLPSEGTVENDKA